MVLRGKAVNDCLAYFASLLITHQHSIRTDILLSRRQIYRQVAISLENICLCHVLWLSFTAILLVYRLSEY